jgi:hypothetical protein
LLFTLLTFPQVEVLRDLRANGPGPLVRRMATYSLLAGALSIGLFGLSIWCARARASDLRDTKKTRMEEERERKTTRL